MRPLGSIDKCKMCGNDYIVNSGLQRFCPACQLPHRLDNDRTGGLKYYNNNKDAINPVRNLLRQIGPVKCSWCGKEFETHNRTKCCSDECKRKAKNRAWNERYHKLKEPN